ncbi:hypothetical protein HZA97_09915 [Candidatus Woesearchaeota archaeon]|nr:hypothetical protein [Candidatus Woesearchaeota archaeon]
MDIEKIKKINEISKNLRAHHFSMSSEEATNEAKSIFGELGSLQQGQALQTMQEPQPSQNLQQASQVLQSQSNNQNGSSVLLLEKKFQIILSQSVKTLKDDLTNLQDTVEFLQQELSKLHQKVAKMQQPTQPIVQQPQQFQQPVQQAQPQQNNVQKPEEPKQTHPRQGNLTSDDVKIEKFFYYGK